MDHLEIRRGGVPTDGARALGLPANSGAAANRGQREGETRISTEAFPAIEGSRPCEQEGSSSGTVMQLQQQGIFPNSCVSRVALGSGSEQRMDRASIVELIHRNLDSALRLVTSAETLQQWVSAFLCLDSEAYLELSEEEYLSTVNALTTIVRASDIEDSARQRLLTLIAKNDRQEQRLLLQYATDNELEAIEGAPDADVEAVVTAIHSAGWDALIPAGCNGTQAAYALFAAYARRMITMDEFATAMTFLRAITGVNEEKQLRFFPIEARALSKYTNSTEEHINEILNAAENVPEHLRYVVLVDGQAYDRFTLLGIEPTFFDKRNPPFGILRSHGELRQMKCGMVSFAVLRQVFPELAPVLHMTPTLQHMANHVLAGRSDYMILFPGDAPVIHGSVDKLLFAAMHDVFHTLGRRLAKQYSPMLIQTFFSRCRLSERHRAQYQAKLGDGVRVLYPFFEEGNFTVRELISYVVDRILGRVVDGDLKAPSWEGYSVKKGTHDSIHLLIVDAYRILRDLALKDIMPRALDLLPDDDLRADLERRKSEILANVDLCFGFDSLN